jgi:putative IMPACT (imprinted ancient) family translation regulator
VDAIVYRTVLKTGKSVYTDRGGRFLGYAFSIDSKTQFKERMKTIVDLHPKASHYCYAYRVGHDGLVWRCSDNGEPAGVAGRPLLCQLDSFGLSNADVIVVRYVGGTLLGVPGLIQAYRTCSKQSIENAQLVEKPIVKSEWIYYNYTQEHYVRRIIEQFNISILGTEQGIFTKMKIEIPVGSFKQVLGIVAATPSTQWKEDELLRL